MYRDERASGTYRKAQATRKYTSTKGPLRDIQKKAGKKSRSVTYTYDEQGRLRDTIEPATNISHKASPETAITTAANKQKKESNRLEARAAGKFTYTNDEHREVRDKHRNPTIQPRVVATKEREELQYDNAKHTKKERVNEPTKGKKKPLRRLEAVITWNKRKEDHE
ncbi:hypothetical protein BJ508DRAFT_310766 [Ascobolus immersus RN42]|uniref:Uncharacterized protein n=1 Tax=Ascobolus immersus RN42 TaxID=1160509 RepID=A0A3N4HXP1_ASCIM|nr:hypothetical protein BJ508DRAFT_310766 [Ascobolus immersus RN42]